ncbi:MAG: Glutaredoxin [Gaiellales bacterium]|jgi:glutaredoxin|nr:Glutaredoxin [Gaiellales bacterium]
MDEAMLVLHQAEWCPFSSAVRELLTEHGVDFVARQVAPYPEDRERLRAETGTDEIPVLVTGGGDIHRGTREIFAYVMSLDAGEYAEGHRDRFYEHLSTRQLQAVGTLVGRVPPEPLTASRSRMLRR